MKRNILIHFIAIAAIIGFPLIADAADSRDADGRLEMYLRGSMTGGWGVQSQYKFTRSGDTYSLSLPSLNGEFKISSTEWTYNYGLAGGEPAEVSRATLLSGVANGANINARDLTDVTISFRMGESFESPNFISIGANGQAAPELPEIKGPEPSGTLPVLYINVYGNDGEYDNEIISPNLAHKNYFPGEYWLEMNGCEWLEQLGSKPEGSKDEPLPLEIKARGNYTRTAFAKKPFKLKLGEKKDLLGLSKSKHFALLAHADDNFGYLRNFTGFDLGKRIGLPWTPWQQPVEVVINGDYRGLYFLTESIRVEKNRVNIEELEDYATAPELISGGYLVELDNYDESNQIRMEEKSCVQGQRLDLLRVTWDTPEEYSEIQKRFVTEQFAEMNDNIGNNSDNTWSLIDMDDAARYYLVEEIVSNTEAYHGSTYLFRNRGENQKWHFSPLWDFGNAFNGSTDRFFYDCDPFGNTWIPSMRMNAKFNEKVKETWMWFMNDRYPGLIENIDAYTRHISEAAKADHERWDDAPLPDSPGARSVADNSDMTSRRNEAVRHLNAKIEWLKSRFGDFSAYPDSKEPAHDTTPCAPLPDYAGGTGSVAGIDDSQSPAIFFTLQGIRISGPVRGEPCIMVKNGTPSKIIVP